jgi:hypothetical protein
MINSVVAVELGKMGYVSFEFRHEKDGVLRLRKVIQVELQLLTFKAGQAKQPEARKCST